LNFAIEQLGDFIPGSLVNNKVERYRSGAVVLDNAGNSPIGNQWLRTESPGFLAAEAVSDGKLEETLSDYRPPEILTDFEFERLSSLWCLRQSC